jgi:hypothetical protein
MLFLNFLPDVIKDLLKHVPTLMIDLVDWKDLAREVPKITARVIKREGYSDLFAKQNPFLAHAGIDTVIATTSQQINAVSSKSIGEFILKTYFSQLYSPHGIFLDLRLHHFYQSAQGFSFKPGPLWVTFDEKFRKGLIRMYEGFYFSNDAELEVGLMETGLLKPEWPVETKAELKAILKSHFANSLEEGMKFELDHFQASFIKIAGFLAQNKVKIPQDFMYLGIYLISMYLALQNVSDALPVTQIFKDVDGQLKSSLSS